MHTGFKVEIAADAVGGMGVADRDALHDGRCAGQGSLDGGCIVAAAFPDRLLDGDTLSGCQIQCPALIPGGADGADIHVTEHGALLQGGLDHIALCEGVIGGAALHDDGNVRVHVVDRDLAVPGTQLLLGGQDQGHIAGKLPALQTPQSLQGSGAAHAAVEALAEHQVVGLVVIEFGGGNHGFANADMEIVHRVFIACGTDIDDHGGDVQRGLIGLFCGRHEVNGLGSNDAGNIFSLCVADQNLAGDQRVLVPAAKLEKAQCAVGLDGVDNETNLIGVGIDHQHRLMAGVFLPADVEVAQEILLNFADGCCPAPGNRHHFLLKAGCAGGVGQLLNHLKCLGIKLHGTFLLKCVSDKPIVSPGEKKVNGQKRKKPDQSRGEKIPGRRCFLCPGTHSDVFFEPVEGDQTNHPIAEAVAEEQHHGNGEQSHPDGGADQLGVEMGDHLHHQTMQQENRQGVLTNVGQQENPPVCQGPQAVHQEDDPDQCHEHHGDPNQRGVAQGGIGVGAEHDFFGQAGKVDTQHRQQHCHSGEGADIEVGSFLGNLAIAHIPAAVQAQNEPGLMHQETGEGGVVAHSAVVSHCNGDNKDTDQTGKLVPCGLLVVQGYQRLVEGAGQQVPQNPVGRGVLQGRLGMIDGIVKENVNGLKHQIGHEPAEYDLLPGKMGKITGQKDESGHMEGIDYPINAVAALKHRTDLQKMSQHNADDQKSADIVKAVVSAASGPGGSRGREKG